MTHEFQNQPMDVYLFLCSLGSRSNPNHQLWLLPQLQQLAALQPVVAFSIVQLPIERIHKLRKRNAHLQPSQVHANTHHRPNNEGRRIGACPTRVDPARGLEYLRLSRAFDVAWVPCEGCYMLVTCYGASNVASSSISKHERRRSVTKKDYAYTRCQRKRRRPWGRRHRRLCRRG